MISIVVCSADIKLYKSFCENISATIGVPFEIVRIENPVSICSGYNEGAAKAKYPFLCFVHEDIDFKTQNWGNLLITHFNSDKDIGLIGFLGCIYKTKMVAWWPHSRIKNVETKRINVIQDYRYDTEKEKNCFLINPDNEFRSQVSNLDGVFLATKKDIWELNRFDNKLLTGFHGYDVDFSLQVSKSKKLYVIYDILIEHFSEGHFDCNCLLDYFKVHKKWKKNLPLLCGEHKIDNEYKYLQNLNHLRKHLKMLIRNGFSFFFIQKKFLFLLTFFDIDCSRLRFSKDIFAEWLFINRFFFAYRIRKRQASHKRGRQQTGKFLQNNL